MSWKILVTFLLSIKQKNVVIDYTCNNKKKMLKKCR